jgi:hypothetical protein
LPGLKLQKLFRVDHQRIGIDRRRSGDCACNDLALREQAFDLRVDQSLAELIHIKNAGNENRQRRQIEKQDAARQAREQVLAEKLAQGRKEATPEDRALPPGPAFAQIRFLAGQAIVPGLCDHVALSALTELPPDLTAWRYVIVYQASRKR